MSELLFWRLYSMLSTLLTTVFLYLWIKPIFYGWVMKSIREEDIERCRKRLVWFRFFYPWDINSLFHLSILSFRLGNTKKAERLFRRFAKKFHKPVDENAGEKKPFDPSDFDDYEPIDVEFVIIGAERSPFENTREKI